MKGHVRLGLILFLAVPVPASAQISSPASVDALAVSGDEILAGSANGLRRSTDGGASFTNVAEVKCPGGVWDVALSHGENEVAVVVCRDLKTTFLRQGDATFQETTQSGPPAGFPAAPYTSPRAHPLIALDPLASGGAHTLAVHYSSTIDGDLVWETFGSATRTAAVRFRGYGGPVAGRYAVRGLFPVVPGHPYALWVSQRDAGLEVVRTLARLPQERRLWPSDPGTVERVAAFPASSLECVAREIVAPGRLLAATRSGLLVSDDEGVSWKRAEALPSVRIRRVVADPLEPGLWSAAVGRTLLRSSDAGISWTVVREFSSEIVSLTLDAEDPARIVAGLSDSTVVSTFLLRSPKAAPSPTRTVKAATPPLAPTDLVVRTEDDGGVLLTWEDRSSHEERYEVELRGQDGAFHTFVSLPSNTTSYRVARTRLPASEVRVRAVNALGEGLSEVAPFPAQSFALPVLTLVDPLGERPSVEILTERPGQIVRLERAGDDAPFHILAEAPTGADRKLVVEVPAVLPEQLAQFRLRVVTLEGLGRPAVARVGRWASPPRVPRLLAAFEEDNELVLEWDDQSLREEGFFLLGNPLHGQGLLHIGRAERNTRVATIPRGQRWTEDAFGLAAVEGINGIGFGERSPEIPVQR